MRITGGAWASRRLIGPRRRQPVRPTTDALREKAFAVLADAVKGRSVLDLFAGTGVVGFEALSRGAAHVTFVDDHPAAGRLVVRNAESLHVDTCRWRFLRRRADAAVRLLARENERFDLIWLDPPFDTWRLGVEALAVVAETNVMAPGGLACLESPSKAEIGELTFAGLSVLRELRSGGSRLTILECAVDRKHDGVVDRTQGGKE